MYLSRLTLNARNPAVRKVLADCRSMHRAIMSAFPPADGAARVEHGVLYRVEAPLKGGPLTVLVQSRSEPDWSRLPASHLDAGHPPALKSVEASHAALEPGMVLHFRLRANPTRKVDTKTGADGLRRNGRRKKLQSEQEQVDWLRRKASVSGFMVLDVRRTNEPGAVGRLAPGADGTEQAGVFFGSVLFDGVLRVTDADAFHKAVSSGIGSGKAFGYGLLSVAPFVRQ